VNGNTKRLQRLGMCGEDHLPYYSLKIKQIGSMAVCSVLWTPQTWKLARIELQDFTSKSKLEE
jgi:hypothetical protein